MKVKSRNSFLIVFYTYFAGKFKGMRKIIFLSSRIFTCFSVSSSSFLSFLSQAFEASCLEGREVPEKRKKEQFKKIVSGIVGVRLLTVLSRLFFFAGIYLEHVVEPLHLNILSKSFH